MSDNQANLKKQSKIGLIIFILFVAIATAEIVWMYNTRQQILELNNDYNPVLVYPQKQ